MIVQSVSVGDTNDISFTLNKDELPKAAEGARSSREGNRREGTRHRGRHRQALASSASACARHSGVAAKLFEALSDGGINIQMISTSEIKTAVIIDEAQHHRSRQRSRTRRSG